MSRERLGNDHHLRGISQTRKFIETGGTPTPRKDRHVGKGAGTPEKPHRKKHGMGRDVTPKDESRLMQEDILPGSPSPAEILEPDHRIPTRGFTSELSPEELEELRHGGPPPGFSMVDSSDDSPGFED